MIIIHVRQGYQVCGPLAQWKIIIIIINVYDNK